MLRDLKYACRMLVKTPAFTLIALLALALGIGATTTVFSAVNALLLRPLPMMQDQVRLLYVTQYFEKLANQDAGLTYPDYLEFKKATSLEGFAASQEVTMIVTGGEKPDRYLGAQISADAFSFLGVQPVLGRLFRPDEDEPRAAPVALIGYDVWQSHFGGDKTVVGRVVPINGAQVTIVGVMPKGWRFPESSDLWMPLQLADKESARRGNYFLNGVAKLKPGVSIESAAAELQTIAGRIAIEHADTNTGCAVRVKPFREQIVGETRTLTLLLMGAVLLVHLIACSNVANLLLARGATRAREIGIRLALGASRRAIVTQLLVESLLLGVIGSALGLLFAVWGVDGIIAAIPVEIPYWVQFDFDPRVFGFAVAIGVLSSVLFGIVPALQASRPHLVETLKEGGRAIGNVKSQRMRNGLVVAELALALVLLIGAGLMFRSFLHLQNTNIGIDPSQTLTFRVGLPPTQYPDPALAGKFFRDLMPALSTLPGVESAGAVSGLPAAGNVGLSALLLEGEAEPKQLQDARVARGVQITPGYFKTARISLSAGRDFTEADNKEAPLVAMIDELAAQKWFPNVDPIGRQLRMFEGPGKPAKWMTIVGVVRSVVYDRLENRKVFPIIYVPEYQNPEIFMSVIMRTKSSPRSYEAAARNAVLSINKDLPIYKVYTMDEIVAQSLWQQKFFGTLFIVFAALALFLAAIGLYGVMAYSVRQRTQEIGVRMALGAQGGDVLKLVTFQGLRLIAFGLGIGVVGAFLASKLLQSSLQGVSSHDPVSFAVVPLLLFSVGALACYVPARAAMMLNPVEALRYE